MAVLVDDRAYQPQGGAAQTLRELAREVCESAGNSGPRLVMSVRCDGNLVTSDRLNTVLDTAVNRYQRLELQTGPVRPMVSAALAQAAQLLDQAGESRGQIADLLAAGDVEKGMAALGALLGQWKQAQAAIPVCAEAMRVDLDSLQVDGTNLNDIVATMKAKLEELRSSLESGDMVLVGDLLRYDFESPLTQCGQLVRELQTRAVPE